MNAVLTDAWLCLSVPDLLRAEPHRVAADLAAAQQRRNLAGQARQLVAWERSVSALQHALAVPEAAGWTVLLEYPLQRLGKRADVVLLSGLAILVLEFKTGSTGSRAAAARQAEDYALDLWDFHAGSRGHPVIPVVVSAAPLSPDTLRQLPIPGVWDAHHASIEGLADTLRSILATVPRGPTLDAAWWLRQPYQPVPTIVEAARMAFAKQAVPDINATRADVQGLRQATAAVLRHVAHARRALERRIVFVTGIPGAGKTRCGLAIAFEAEAETRGVFLTGNPSLIHVFREALARDAARRGAQLRAARQQMEQRIQPLPAFRDHYAASAEVPDEHVVVIDEAQRSWSRAHAIRKTADRPRPLTDSEPGHILDAMGRHLDWAVVVCLVGGGQEIHDGEGGLAEWGAALAARPGWRAFAPPRVVAAVDPRQRLPASILVGQDGALHLGVPVRQIKSNHAADWVDAVLADQPAVAAQLAADAPLPYLLTRDLPTMRSALRLLARGHRRAGLIGSAGARRLRGDGLGVELPHMDRNAVARWFLDRWPDDVRASDALEVLATEFSCQGLELDYAGLAWGGDLVRGGRGWQVRFFHGTDWKPRRPEAEAWSNQVNTYRVLLTRARYETVIWVPRGDEEDRTRDPREFGAIADFLLACGARPLDLAALAPAPPAAAPALL